MNLVVAGQAANRLLEPSVAVAVSSLEVQPEPEKKSLFVISPARSVSSFPGFFFNCC
jgi:hypothetical protein